MKKQGNCPKCDSENLDYETIVDSPLSEQTVYYPVECLDCGYKGKEYYDIHFAYYLQNL